MFLLIFHKLYKTVADMNDPSTVTDDHLIGAEGFVELTNKIGER